MTTSRLTDEQVDFLERRAAGGRLPTLHEVRALLSEVRERREGERRGEPKRRRCMCGSVMLPRSFDTIGGVTHRTHSYCGPAPAAGSPDTRTDGSNGEGA